MTATNLFCTQLAMNRLPLPAVLIDIIKSYTFYNIKKQTKERKDKIMRLINTSFWTPFYYPRQIYLNIGGWFYWIDEDDKCPQFQSAFCVICGNYIEETNIKLICYCRRQL